MGTLVPRSGLGDHDCRLRSTAPFHFASNLTRIYVVSSDDNGATWEYETQVEVRFLCPAASVWELLISRHDGWQLHSDAREPFFVTINNTLWFSFFQAGTDPLAFEPQFLFRMRYLGSRGQWSAMEKWGHAGEIAWQLGEDGGVGYTTSYEVCFRPQPGG